MTLLSRISNRWADQIEQQQGQHFQGALAAGFPPANLANLPKFPNAPTGRATDGVGPAHGGATGPAAWGDDGDGMAPPFAFPIHGGGAADGIAGHGVTRITADGGKLPTVGKKRGADGPAADDSPDSPDAPDGSDAPDGPGGPDGSEDPPPSDKDQDFKLREPTLSPPPEQSPHLDMPDLKMTIEPPSATDHPRVGPADLSPKGEPANQPSNYVGGSVPPPPEPPPTEGVAGWVGTHVTGTRNAVDPSQPIIIGYRNMPAPNRDPDPTGPAPRDASPPPIKAPPPDPAPVPSPPPSGPPTSDQPRDKPHP
jgi:hypothetical protein